MPWNNEKRLRYMTTESPKTSFFSSNLPDAAVWNNLYTHSNKVTKYTEPNTIFLFLTMKYRKTKLTDDQFSNINNYYKNDKQAALSNMYTWNHFRRLPSIWKKYN